MAGDSYTLEIQIPGYRIYKSDKYPVSKGDTKIEDVIDELKAKGLWIEGSNLFYDDKQLDPKQTLTWYGISLRKHVLFLRKPREIKCFSGSTLEDIEREMTAWIEMYPRKNVVSMSVSGTDS